MDYVLHSTNVLAKKGHRLTGQRLGIIEFFRDSKFPCNAYDISKKINIGTKKADVVSIYRTLSILENFNLIHKTSEGKYIKCQEFACLNDRHCHHQFTCDLCGKVYEMHMEDDIFIKQTIKKFPKLNIKSHYFSFNGTCEKCKI